MRASLGHEHFEELQLLKGPWKEEVFNFAKANDTADDDEPDVAEILEYEAMLHAEEELAELDRILALPTAAVVL